MAGARDDTRRAPAPAPTLLRRRAEARAETVEELVERFVRGRVRVPSFQRGLRWGASDVTDLFDSVYRGYPIGSLLLWQRRAPAARVTAGPLSIDAPETEAWWVVDGQQRLTALAASLARPLPLPAHPADPYVVYFDPAGQRFLSPEKGRAPPSEWVPAPLLLDASRLSEWIVAWPHFADAALRSAVFDAGRRLREYSVPLYVVDTDDEGVLREIFYRVNSAGKRLKWAEVHDALFGQPDARPGSLAELSTEIAKLHMGTLDHATLLSCLLALRGMDVTRTLAEHRRRDPAALDGAVAACLPVLARVLSFLRESADISHVRLLPRALPLAPLTRFFALHPEPKARTRQLLTRFCWRLFLGDGGLDERVVARRGVTVIEPGTEEVSAQRLLSLAPAQPAFVVPEAVDARAAGTRVAMVALSLAAPRHLGTGEVIDVASLLEAEAGRALRSVIEGERSPGARSPAGRALHPSVRALPGVLRGRCAEARAARELLDSHLVGAAAARALARGDTDGFLAARRRDLSRAVDDLGDRLAAWGRSSRVSVDGLLRWPSGGP
ncbi:MAG: DUF262 domain-containing protein [Polyangiaceae bacterium]|nr:DUF262 domain-containing protein [Polyangiaceae bacterium]